MSSEPVWPAELFTDLDRNGPVPLYYQVSSRLERAIRSNEIPAGARLENEIAIGERLGLSRPTIRRAIQELVDKGLLVRRRGIGTQVVQGRVNRPVELTSLYDDLQSTRHEPTTVSLIHAVVPATAEIAEQLRVAEGTDVLHLRRVRSSDGTPVAILENYLPAPYTDITEGDLDTRGLYQVLRARGVAIRIANQAISARRAHGDEADLLGVSRGGPVLTTERVVFNDAGEVVEYGTHCYRPDLYRFETTLVAK